jgi:hypothetical protein
MLKIFFTVIVFVAFCGSANADTNEFEETAGAVPSCGSLPHGRKARLIKEGATYFILATLLEDQGRGSLRPEYDDPESLCIAEQFQVGSWQVAATYAGFKKGIQTLLYRFEVGGEGEREFLVLYSGMLSFMSGNNFTFSVSETRGNTVDIYAIYNREPPYKQVRSLVEGILAEEEAPIVSAEWQDGEDELIITVFDSDRLK